MCCEANLTTLFYCIPHLGSPAPFHDPMITGQLSKPLLSLRSEMSVAELRAEDKAATPDSELNDESLLLSSEARDREDIPNKLYGESMDRTALGLSSPFGDRSWHERPGECSASVCVG